MADCDAQHSSIRLPRRAAHDSLGGYRSGRSCAPDIRGGSQRRTADGVDSTETPVLLRTAGPDDLTAARAMHARCSAFTLAHRYPGPPGEADRYLGHLLSPRFGRSLAAETTPGHVVGLAHLLWDDDEAEIALLVEDEWQRRGIGTAMLRSLLAIALRERREIVYTVTSTADTAMPALMRGTGLPLERHTEGSTLVLSARVTALPAAALPLAAGG
ncbi:GNAT family N-acetyltransferase [Streptomyces avicenniae]|uniref:GNAT family N-acetyltransferase n=1 Tax=Streptomyces avicenniae TaxID=500153 RepID=UPI00069B0FBD